MKRPFGLLAESYLNWRDDGNEHVLVEYSKKHMETLGNDVVFDWIPLVGSGIVVLPCEPDVAFALPNWVFV